MEFLFILSDKHCFVDLHLIHIWNKADVNNWFFWSPCDGPNGSIIQLENWAIHIQTSQVKSLFLQAQVFHHLRWLCFVITLLYHFQKSKKEVKGINFFIFIISYLNFLIQIFELDWFLISGMSNFKLQCWKLLAANEDLWIWLLKGEGEQRRKEWGEGFLKSNWRIKEEKGAVLDHVSSVNFKFSKCYFCSMKKMHIRHLMKELS